jgi:hypothetical protein
MKTKHFFTPLLFLIFLLGQAQAARVWTYYDINNHPLQSPSDKEIKELAVKRISNDNVTQYLLEISYNFAGTQSAGYFENIGNATPAIGQHWIDQNEIIACQVEGIAKDLASINSRYISVGYTSKGAPNITGNVHALQFNGTNEYVSASGLSLAYASSWSIEFWAKRDQLGRKDKIISQGEMSAYKGFEAGYTDSDTFVFMLPFAGDIETQPFDDLSWHRWKCRYIRVNQWSDVLNDYAYVTSLYLYRDTVEVGTVEFISNHYHSSQDIIQIGKGLTGNYFKGSVKDVIVTKDGRIIANWPLNDNSRTASDASGNNHTATLNNFSENCWLDDPSIVQAYDFSQVQDIQEIPQFKMISWAKISYSWSRQFLIRMNTTIEEMNNYIRIDVLDDSGQPGAVGKGVWWYNYGTAMKIWAQSNLLYDVTGFHNNLSDLDYETDSIVINELNNELNITWLFEKHIYEIEALAGNPVSLESIPSEIQTQLLFTEPSSSSDTTSEGVDVNDAKESSENLYYWSAYEKKIYPLIGERTFRLEWDAGTMGKLVTKIHVAWPPDDYYIPHIAETPPIILDPSTEDIVSFQEIKHSENDASLAEDNDGFQATTNGKNVLMFSRKFSTDIVPKDVALKFDGIDDYVDLGKYIDIDENNFTVEFWAQRSITDTAQMLISQDPDPTRRGLQIGFNEDNTFSFGYYGDLLTTSTAYTDTDWHHYACSYESVLPDPDVDYGPKVISLGFDGVDDFVDITDPLPLGDEFTIEFWSKANESKFQTVIGQGIRDTNKGLHIGFLDDSRFTFGFYNNDLITDNIYPDIAWHHWACSYQNLGPYKVKEVALSFYYYGYVQVPEGVWFSGDFTIESWVYLKEGRHWARIIDFGNGPEKDNIILVSSEGDDGPPGLQIKNSSGFEDLFAPFNLPVETWAHLAATLEGSTVKIYINGELVATKEFSRLPENVNRTRCYIGKSNWSSDPTFWGYMDDVRIWNRALSKQEIRNQKDQELAGTESGLMGYWRFNEGKGRIAKDSSGNGNDATLMEMTEQPWIFNNPDPVVTSKPKDRYIEFDNSNDFLDAGNIPLNNQSFTIEFWAKRYAVDEWDFVIGQGQGDTNRHFHVSFREANTFSMGFGYNDVDSTETYTDTDWHHWAVSYDTNTMTQKLYRDGVMVASRTATSHFLGTGNLYIGRYCADNLHNYNGALDDLRIWYVVRTQEQIQENKDIELSGDEEGLVAYWKFNEINGFAASDSSNGMHTAYLINMRSNPFKPADIDPLDITNLDWHGRVIPSDPKVRTLRFMGGVDKYQNYYVEILEHTNDINQKVIEPSGDKWTIELWFKAERTSGTNFLIDKYLSYQLAVRDGYFVYALWPYWTFSNAFPVEANKWYHVALVYDGEKQKVYTNGEKVFERNQTGAIAPNSNKLFFGDAYTNSYVYTFKGEMDEIRIWSTARTQEEIFTNKDHMLIGNEKGLVGYWPCNEINGRLVFDHSPNKWHGINWADISRIGRGYNPSNIINPTQTWLAFDGIDDHITVPSAVWFSGDFTIESWVYLDDYNDYAKIIDFGNGEYNDTVSLCASDQQTGKPSLQIDNNGGDHYSLPSPDAIPMHTWTHLAASLSGTTAKLYINGIEVASGTAPVPTNINRTLNYIGQSNTASDAHFKGKLDEIRIWSDARSIEDIQLNLGKQLTGNETGLIGYWRLDERSGAVASDSSSYSKNGSLVNIDTENSWKYAPKTEKPTQKALSFDFNDDYATLPPDVWFDGDFTIEVWVYLRTYSGYPIILDIGKGPHDHNILLMPSHINFNNCPYLYMGNSFEENNHFSTPNPLPLYTWCHLAATLTGSTMRLYVNGKEEASAETRYIPENVVRTSNYIGKSNWETIYPQNNNKLDGMIDDLRIWSVAKTADEIRASYTKTLTGNEANLTGYWKFDEMSGNKAIDSSQNSNHATLVNMDTKKSWVTDSPDILSNPKYFGLDMDGINSFVEVGDNVWFDGGNFTIEAWVYMKKYASWCRIIDFANGQGVDNVILAASKEVDGTPSMHIFNSGKQFSLYTDKKIPLKKWTHVAVTLDDDNQVVMYLDGVKIASKTTDILPVNVNRVNCYIGKSNWPDGLFDGYMDDVRIWNVARTQEQIINNKERPLYGNEYGLIGYWNMNDNVHIIKDMASGKHGHYTTYWRFYVPESRSFPNIKFVHMSTKNNTYIEIPHQNVLNTDQELTLETWVKPIQTGNTIIAGKFNENFNKGYLIRLNTSKELIAEIWDQAGAKYELNLGSLTVSQWSHIAVTWMKNGKFTGYIDGVKVRQINASQESIAMTSDPFYISYSTNISQVRIDEVRAWCVSRSYSEIQQDMNQRLVGLEPGLIGYWRLDEAEGNVVKDSTLNYSHGYIYSDDDIDDTWAIDSRINRSIYRDGILIATDEPSQPYSSSGGVTIGATPWSTEFFNGQVDDIRVWNSVRTPDEIASNMETRLTSAEADDLVRYWRIDEGNSSAIADNVLCSLTACESMPVTNQGVLLGSEEPDTNWNNKVFNRRIYRDTEMVAQDQVEIVYAASGSMLLGKSTLNKDYFCGSIDELRFWNITHGNFGLSANKDIRLTGNEDHLTAYYRMDRQGMPYLEDSSGNFHYGTLMNKVPSLVSDNWQINPAVVFPVAIGDLDKELACVRIVETQQWYEAHSTDTATVATELFSNAHDTQCPHNGYMFRERAFYNANIHDRDTMIGPIIPVNIEVSPYDKNDDFLVVWYDMHDGAAFSYTSVEYTVEWPQKHRIVIASRFGSEGCDANLVDQTFPDTSGITQNFLDNARYQDLDIYNQPDRTLPGYNPNEEHGLVANSFRHTNRVSIPKAVFALRNDLNITTRQADIYTSDPYVLLEYFDLTLDKYQMAAFSIDISDTAAGYVLNYSMIAGEPVVAPYPLNLVIASTRPKEEIFGKNGDPEQKSYWEDLKGQPWAISGDTHLFAYFWYPLQADQWYQESRYGNENDKAVKTPGDGTGSVGASIPWLPVANVVSDDHFPNQMIGRAKSAEVKYNTKWPSSLPIIKAGETLTFSGGEYRTDNTTSPGLPGVLAWSAGQVVYDDLNKTMDSTDVFYKYLVRLDQVLMEKTVDLPMEKYPEALKPAGNRVDVVGTRWYFKELHAGIKSRFFYDAMTGQLGICGFVNDKTAGDKTLTATPPFMYVLQPNILTERERDTIKTITGVNFNFKDAVDKLYRLSRNPVGFTGKDYTVGIDTYVDIHGLSHPTLGMPVSALGPGLALMPNAALLDPENPIFSAFNEGYIVLAKDNHPDLDTLTVDLQIIKIIKEKYRGAIKPIYSDNVFNEKITLRHTGDFGANANELIFQWWYREEDGAYVNTPELDFNQWNEFPDPTGNKGLGQYEVSMQGTGAALLVDNLFYVRYRHALCDPRSLSNCWSDWAGAANSRPGDYQAQLAEGWVKRVINAVNPYEARVTSFYNIDNPATYVSMIQQAGMRFEGSVELNPDKDIIENFGLIELYQTVLERAMDLSINLDDPVCTSGITAALLLASSRIADFYKLLGDEAYTDALDPTIGYVSSDNDVSEYGSLAPTIFAFMNQVPTLLDEELALLRGIDERGARPAYNRLMWNFTKSKGEVAYANAYAIWDYNKDGFIDELDGQSLFPQGHGDAWGHYLSGLKGYYELLGHPFFKWESRAELFGMQGIVIDVDYLDEEAFASVAAAKAKAGAEIMNLTYRSKYVDDPGGQWQGYEDTDASRAWGVASWGRRCFQGAYFDWLTANTLLPPDANALTKTGLNQIDRKRVVDLSDIVSNAQIIQQQYDETNAGLNPLGMSPDAVTFDIDPSRVTPGSSHSATHFEQIYERTLNAMNNAKAIYDHANKTKKSIRNVVITAEDFVDMVTDKDKEYRDRLIEIFGSPYEGTIGPGKTYPYGYVGPDYYLYQYIDVSEFSASTVPPSNESFKAFFSPLPDPDLYDYQVLKEGKNEVYKNLPFIFMHFFSMDIEYDAYNDSECNGLLEIEYPMSTSDYAFHAPSEWGLRESPGSIQLALIELMKAEADVRLGLIDYSGLIGSMNTLLIVLEGRSGLHAGLIDVINKTKNKVRLLSYIINGLNALSSTMFLAGDTMGDLSDLLAESLPETVGFSNDATSVARSNLMFMGLGWKTILASAGLALETSAMFVETEKELVDYDMEIELEEKNYTYEVKEILREFEALMGTEVVIRVEIFHKLESMRKISEQYRSELAKGVRLLEERETFNKRVASKVQKKRYMDMALRLNLSSELSKYKNAFDTAAKYVYLAAKAYDYETNLSANDPASARPILTKIMQKRTLGQYENNQWVSGQGGLGELLTGLKIRYDMLKGQMGFNNPQTETGRFSLRSELFRIKGSDGKAGPQNDQVWQQTLMDNQVENLWDVPEFHKYCRPFAPRSAGPQPGIVIKFNTEVIFGKNFFGWPLSGGDHAYDPTNYATKIRSVGTWFEGYNNGLLSETPRIFLIPTGMDVMLVPNSFFLDTREWLVVDQKIPIPLPVESTDLINPDWIPSLDTLDGFLTKIRRYSSFRAYHDSGYWDESQMVYDSRLVGRSVWNSSWVLIIPGGTLHYDPDYGLEMFVQTVKDIKLFFQTYAISGM